MRYSMLFLFPIVFLIFCFYLILGYFLSDVIILTFLIWPQLFMALTILAIIIENEERDHAIEQRKLKEWEEWEIVHKEAVKQIAIATRDIGKKIKK